MCGIFGFYGDNPNKNLLVKSSKYLNHRGPDDYNFYFCPKNKIFISHSRLAIIDLKYGKQPMTSICGNFCITFNGEIYNSNELKKDLLAKSYKFKTNNSDTEVLLNGFSEWKEKLFEKINGMFALAIYDKNNSKLFLARDRFGQKPLFFVFKNNNFFFSSEIKPLFFYVKNVVNKIAIAKSLAYGFIPGSDTIYKDISKLQHGSYLEFDINKKKITSQNYWKFRIKENKQFKKKAEIIEEFSEVFSRSLKRTMISDVPVGIFLSGGIDSSIITHEAVKINSQIKTFNIGFSEVSFDEKEYASIVSQFLDTRHFTKNFGVNDLLKNIDKIFEKIDEPILDPSLLPTYFLSKFTSKYVKVALSGDGADELFGGYDTFRALKYAKVFEKLFSKPTLNKFKKFAHLLPISSINMGIDFKIKRGLAGLGGGQSLWNPLWLAPAYIKEINHLFDCNYTNEEIYEDAVKLWNESESKDLIEKTSEFYNNFYLSENILVKTDRASMLNSLETRAPFLDNDVVDFAINLPSKFKVNKNLLKLTYAKKLPRKILYRQKKGFGIPLIKWLKNLSYDERTLRFGNFNFLELQKIVANHGKRGDFRLLLWSIFVYSKLRLT